MFLVKYVVSTICAARFFNEVLQVGELIISSVNNFIDGTFKYSLKHYFFYDWAYKGFISPYRLLNNSLQRNDNLHDHIRFNNSLYGGFFV